MGVPVLRPIDKGPIPARALSVRKVSAGGGGPCSNGSARLGTCKRQLAARRRNIVRIIY
jgi:hypothetical protein